MTSFSLMLVRAEQREYQVSSDADLCAGTVLGFGPILNESLDRFRHHFEVNTLGPVMLYQSIRALIPTGGVFAVTSSAAGSISEDVEFPAGSYGVSKAAVNAVIARIGYEDKEIVALALQCVPSKVRARSLTVAPL